MQANDEETWNRYAYVANNPLANIDFLGLACKRGNRPGAQLEGCNMPGLSGGGEVSIDGGSAIPIGLFGDSGSFGSGLGGGESAVPCLPGNCANTVGDAAGNVFLDRYSNTLDINCVGGSFTGDNANYQCSLSHWSRWFVYNGDKTYYFGGVQQLLNANSDTWRNASGAGNAAAIATGAVLVAVPLVGEAMGAIAACDPGLNTSNYGHITVYCRAWMPGNLIGIGYDPHNGLHVNVGGSIHIPLWPWP